MFNKLGYCRACIRKFSMFSKLGYFMACIRMFMFIIDSCADKFKQDHSNVCKALSVLNPLSSWYADLFTDMLSGC